MLMPCQKKSGYGGRPIAEALDLLGFRVYTPSLGATGAKSIYDPLGGY